MKKNLKNLGIKVEFAQSNIEGELVNIIQESKKKFDGIIINAAAFTHTSVAIRDALDIYKKPIIELHISNIYKREEFRQKSLISDIVTWWNFWFGSWWLYFSHNFYAKAFKKWKLIKKLIKELTDNLKEFKFNRA